MGDCPDPPTGVGQQEWGLGSLEGSGQEAEPGGVWLVHPYMGMLSWGFPWNHFQAVELKKTPCSQIQSWLHAWLGLCHPIPAHPQPGMPPQPCFPGNPACSGCADTLGEPGGGRAVSVGVSSSQIPAQHLPGSGELHTGRAHTAKLLPGSVKGGSESVATTGMKLD